MENHSLIRQRLFYIMGAAILALVILAIIGFQRFPFVSIGILGLVAWNSYRFYKLAKTQPWK